MKLVIGGIDSLIAGRYELRVCLNASYMSSVFQAWDRQQECFVVVKIAMNNSIVLNSVEYLKYEVLALKRLDHPRIVRLLDFGDINESTYFIVLEYIHGRELARNLESQGRLSLNGSISTGIQVLEGLEAIHQAGLVHQDIKPENLLVTSDGIKIIDLGTAKFVSLGDGNMKSLHDPGMTVGTLPYMSPEQACGKENVDIRSDIYSCGVLLYEMVTGLFPFPKFKEDGKALQYWGLPLRSFSEVELPIIIPDKVQEIIWHAMAVPRLLRYQTAEEMRMALLTVL